MSLSDFCDLFTRDIVNTGGSHSYVVCLEDYLHEGAERYKLCYRMALLNPRHDSIDNVLPSYYFWDHGLKKLTDLKGIPIPGWTIRASVSRGAYKWYLPNLKPPT